MEKSVNFSFVNKSGDSKGTRDGPEEESGWTSYLEDFLSDQKEHSFCSYSSHGSPSLVSDAASRVPWKASNTGNQIVACPSSIDASPKFPNKLSFNKKRSTKDKNSYDDSLEDTASSPVNSPKVSSLRQMDSNPRKTDDNMETSLGKGGAYDTQKQAHERSEMNLDGTKKNVDYAHNLKKKGLCIVPMSMLVNYLGY